MSETVTGVPGLPDLTHPNELIQFGGELLKLSQKIAILVIFLGIALALAGLALRRTKPELIDWLEIWIKRYDLLLRKFPHAVLIFSLMMGGFFLCSTLANRYHHWEQARVAKVAASVAGDRLEQFAPQVRYVVKEPYTYDTQVKGKIVRVKATRDINRFLTVGGSQINVKLEQIKDVQNLRSVYRVDFQGDYKVKNPLKEKEEFFFEINPPNGYSLLQNFKVERDNNRLVPVNPGDYGFPLRLEAGEETMFRVSYQAQGGPRWVYDANGQLLSNFRLTALANFANADFASGIVPTQIKVEGQGTRFIWVFNDNVSVKNPFGVFTSTGKVTNTGILPRLLLLAPALFFWWIVLLYLSVPLTLQDIVLAGSLFFASLLTLTYLSRVIDAQLAWCLISPVMLVLVWGLGNSRSASIAAVIATIAGGVLPVFGLVTTYSGLTLSLAGLLSVVWVAVLHWYRLYRVSDQPTSRAKYDL